MCKTNRMKQIAFLIFFSSYFYGNTQNPYAPYPNGWGATWVYEHEVWNGSEPVYWFSEMVWGGDTTINAVSYTKAQQFGTETVYFRQNVATEEAYILDTNHIEYSIAFPHDAMVGDTVYFELNALRFLSSGMLPAPGEAPFVVVESLGSANFQGQLRNRYELSVPGTGGASFIEGIGFIGISGFEHGFGLACHSVNNNWIVVPNPSPFWPAGPYCVLSVEDLEMAHLRMYPNPSTGVIKFNADLTTLISFELFSSDSKRVEKSNYDLFSDGINISGLTPGVYQAQFVFESGTIVQKIVKQ